MAENFAPLNFKNTILDQLSITVFGIAADGQKNGTPIAGAPSPKPRYVRRPATSFPLKLVSVLSSGCLPASALSIVVAKFGSFPSAAASSFSVSSAAGAEPTIPAIADFTKAVVAICVLLTDCAAVGAVGVPVSAGLDNGAFSASALLMVVLKFGSLLMAAAISFSVSSVAGAPLIRAVSAACTNAVVATCVVLFPAAGVGALGVPVNVGLAFGAYCECGSGAARCFAI
ncbi:hypothetical protein HmCmsJML295_02098 [Escherichia coli]|nr:hypothetical protein HmCmsJML295_02098 [Escherichia coli]